jgi:hypothetical protein
MTVIRKTPIFALYMIRLVVAYTLTFLILLAQVGLPVHMHYCKGMLESVSVFFNSGCDDHEEITDLAVCCQNATDGHCSKNGDNCCDDEVKVLTQGITSVPPHFDKWVDLVTLFHSTLAFIPANTQKDLYTRSPYEVGEVSSPPVYILYHSLIFYA